jgi:hypothetical protein
MVARTCRRRIQGELTASPEAALFAVAANRSCVPRRALDEGLSAAWDLGRIISAKNAAARASASGPVARDLRASTPFLVGVCWTILGTLIAADWADFRRFGRWR